MKYTTEKYKNESYLRNRINSEYPILFNRIDWNMTEENLEELCIFQKEHDDILPWLLFSSETWIKIYNLILVVDPKKIGNFSKLKHSSKYTSYDYVYKFIQKYPEWNKLVFYDENPNDLQDKLLEIYIDKTLPIKFNRINWQKVDQKIDEIYEILLKQEIKTIPSILFINTPNIKENMSKHYIKITEKNERILL